MKTWRPVTWIRLFVLDTKSPSHSEHDLQTVIKGHTCSHRGERKKVCFLFPNKHPETRCIVSPESDEEVNYDFSNVWFLFVSCLNAQLHANLSVFSTWTDAERARPKKAQVPFKAVRVRNWSHSILVCLHAFVSAPGLGQSSSVLHGYLRSCEQV